MSGYCDSAPGHPLHGPYHDSEYGFPVDDESVLFERLVLEIFQAGLSWLIVLKKRPGFAKAFYGYDVDRIAKMKEKDIARLLADEGIIRNRLKIVATIHNAKVVQDLRKSHGGFAQWIQDHHPMNLEDWCKLFRKTFKFTGKEVVNEFLMSIGYLPGAHRESCPVFKKIAKQKPAWKTRALRSAGFLLAALLFANAAEAADVSSKVRISSADCRRVATYRPSADVDYKAGVDAHGRKVAGADLPGGNNQIKLPEVLSFDVKIDFAKYLPSSNTSSSQAAAASTAAIAADKAKSAVNAAQTAATSARAAATAAANAVTTAQATKTAADTALATAISAHDKDPTNKTKRDAVTTAQTAADNAATALSTAQSQSSTISTAATAAQTAATNAASAGSTSDIISFATTAQTNAATAGTTAQQSSTAGVRTAGQTASSDATSLNSAITTATSAQTANTNAFNITSPTGALPEGSAGTVKYDLRTGRMTFNDQPLDDDATREMQVACQRVLSGR